MIANSEGLLKFATIIVDNLPLLGVLAQPHFVESPAYTCMSCQRPHQWSFAVLANYSSDFLNEQYIHS